MALIEASFNKNQTNMHEMQDEYVSQGGSIVKGGNKLKAILDKAKNEPKKMKIFSKLMTNKPAMNKPNFTKQISQWSPTASNSSLMQKHTANIFAKIPALEKVKTGSTASSSEDDPEGTHQKIVMNKLYDHDSAVSSQSYIDSEIFEEDRSISYLLAF